MRTNTNNINNRTNINNKYPLGLQLKLEELM